MHTGSAPGVRAIAVRALTAAAAVAISAVAAAADADPVTACAPAGAAWEHASGSGDLAAMRSAMHAIPSVCANLRARALGRIASLETAAHHPAPARVERPASAPPPPAEAAGSLAEVLNTIETEMVSQGPVAWEGFAHDSAAQPGYNADWTYQKQVVATNFSYDTASCDFDYRFRVTTDGKVSTDDDDAGIPLKDLSSIRVANLADLIKARDAQAGHPTYSSRLQPPIYAIEAIRGDGKYNELDFYSHDSARRVAQLLQAAAAKCGVHAVVRD